MQTRAGLGKARELYEQRFENARELRLRTGEKIMGYFCCHTPVELITAAGLHPFRIVGDMSESVTSANSCLEAIMCPFVRSCFDIALKGRYDFLDGLVIPHTCDNIEKSYDMWRFYLNLPFTHMLNIPHMVHPTSFDFFAREIGLLRRKLSKFTGKDISDTELWNAIRSQNRIRALVGELYELRKKDPPPISGSKVMQIILAGMAIPVASFEELLREVLEEVKIRETTATAKTPRLLLYGSEIDDISFIELIEDCGAKVVTDDLCTGSRAFNYSVKESGNPEMALAQTYLGDIPCPRTCRDVAPQERFQYLVDLARSYRVDGVIMHITRFCDTHAFDAPDIQRVLQEAGYPVLFIEADYNLAAIQQLRTRIQAFIEMIQ